MIADIEKARKLAVNDQRLNRRFALNALRISLVHTGICVVYFAGDYFGGPELGWPAFTALFAVIWLLNGLYLTLVLSGWIEHWPDPVLSVPVTLWLTTTFLVTAYFVDSFRVSVVMLFFFAMLLTSFRKGFWVLSGLSLYAIAGYAAVVALAISDRSMELQWSSEILQWFIFTLTCLGFVFTGTLINRLRRRLADKNEQLAEALEQVREMAIRDELTGLFNRRHVMEILGQQQALADSGDYAFSICYLDLDLFKPINDRFGHGVGDQVLTRFAQIAQQGLREADYIGRLGGEEFILMLPDTDHEEAWRVAERVRARLEETDFSDLHEELRVTVSAGVAEYHAGEDLDAVMARADLCLYQAKDRGRNQVVYEADPACKTQALQA